VIGGPLFEIVLVLFFVFLTLSGIVSLLNEVFAQGFQLKAGNLHKCIRELLGDEHYKDHISKRFFEHPLVTSLGGRRRRPTWVSEDVFAIAFATAIQPDWSKADPIESLPVSIDALQDGPLKDRLRLALPQVKPGASRETISASIKTWFDTNGQRMSDRYKADSRARLYIIAAVVTVLFNVSPIEILKRLQSDNTLRTTFASAVPELTTMLYNSGQGVPFSLAQGDDFTGPAKAPVTSAATPPAPTATPPAGLTPAPGAAASPAPSADTSAAATALAGSLTHKVDAQRMLALFHCSQNELSLPIGWPWMAELTDRVANSRVSSFISVDSDQRSCQRALAEAGASQDLVNKLSVIGGSRLADQATQARAAMDSKTAMPASAPTFQKQYGPSFDRDPPLNILLGWLIAIFAGAQGAPFWFNVLKKLIERKP
jgi:hypothetical protein